MFLLLVLRIGATIKDKSQLSNRNEPKKEVQTDDDKVTWLIGNNKIVFQYKKGTSGADTSDITSFNSTDYPKLFENLDFNVIKVTPFKTGTKTLYLISNEFYQAAGYTLHHAIIVDILAGEKVEYETNKNNTQGSFHTLTILNDGEIKSSFVYGAYNFCRSCGYFLSEFLAYKPGEGFVTNNAAHKEEFKKMLADIELNNHCAIVDGGKQMTFEEINKQYGEDYGCRSSDITPKLVGTTPKEYFVIKDKVNRILKGEKVSLLDNNL